MFAGGGGAKIIVTSLSHRHEISKQVSFLGIISIVEGECAYKTTAKTATMIMNGSSKRVRYNYFINMKRQQPENKPALSDGSVVFGRWRQQNMNV